MTRLPAIVLAACLLAGCDPIEPYDDILPPPRDGGTDRQLPPDDAEPDSDRDGGEPDDGGSDSGPEDLLECGYPASGYGIWSGRNLEPFALWTCGEERTTLPRLWCDRGATIVHLNVAWCGICLASTHRILADVMPRLEGRDVALVEIVVEGTVPGVAADAEICAWWEDYFEDRIEAHVPVDGSTSGALWRLAASDTLPLTLVLDRHGTIRVWSGLVLPEDLAEQILGILDES